MTDPLSMISLSQTLQHLQTGTSPAIYVANMLATYDLKVTPPGAPISSSHNAKEVWAELLRTSTPGHLLTQVPSEWQQDQPLFSALKSILYAEALAQKAYRNAGGKPTAVELQTIQSHLDIMLGSAEPKTEAQRWLMPAAYHQIGARINLAELASAVVRLQFTVEAALPQLRKAALRPLHNSLTWDTPLGRVCIGGAGNDHYSGEYLLLIDLAGKDTYDNVAPPRQLANVSVVIDLSGDDTVHWKNSQGPGAGIMSISIWDDLAGNDRYIGGSAGLGVGLLGAGMLWDAAGNDSYQGSSLVQGAGDYGVGVLLDEGGKDHYEAALAGQGFGGPGGIGILADLDGNDAYSCGGLVPDSVMDRQLRHGVTHYYSYGQGYGFGLRPPQVSGGIGLLLDRGGNDVYDADLFAQGGSYWFGLGMLVDRKGNDRYRCVEHCQGESLHAGAAILADWDGNDQYDAYEHAQGVGVDRAAGILYEHGGNDRYHANRDSQGAGIKPFGIGMLIDAGGNDRYEAAQTSQGFAADPNGPEGFPVDQWPVGILLDLKGTDSYLQTDVPVPRSNGRIQNRQGIAVSH